ncbi:MAG: tetratricopeptide repeat protein [Bacteroidales bacterium]|nr:tetratricopeptide repeat protein [Bacteroidales bacterium]
MFCSLAAGFDAAAQHKYSDSYNFQRGYDAYSNENYVEAIEYFNKEVEQHPDNAYAYTLIAIIRWQNDELGKALAAVNLALKNTPKKDKDWKAYSLRVRSRIYGDLEDDQAALKDLGDAIALCPKDEDGYKDRAQLYYTMGDYEASDRDIYQWRKISPDDMMADMYLGRNRLEMKKYQDAVNIFDNVIALYSDYSSGYSFRAEAYFGLGDCASAASDVVTALGIDSDSKAFNLMVEHSEDAYTNLITRLKAKALSEPNNGFWQYCQGAVNESAEKYGAAVETYSKAMTKDPSDITAFRISSCYEKMGNWKKAHEYIDKAIEMDPDYVSYRSTKANLYYYSGDFENAILEIDKCVEAEPETAFYYRRRGLFKANNGDFEGALEDYTSAIVLSPKTAYPYIHRGKIYLECGEEDKAKEDFNMCVAIDTLPGDASCAEYAYFYLGQTEKAIEFMDRLLEYDEDGYLYDAACLYSLMGEREKALSYFRKALESGYNNFNHIRCDSDLDNIRETDEFKELIAKYAPEQFTSSSGEETDSAGYVERVVEVPFVRANGVTKVKCSINGLPLQFILDTGASTVSISSLEATFMYKNDYLTSKDIVGKSTFVDANGDISVGTVINLSNVTFAGLELEDVRATVVSNDKAPLLLGQTVLSRLGKVEIDYEANVIRVTVRERK